MPGITGIMTDIAPELATERLRAMTQCMLHESSYSWGLHTVPELGFYVGWVRRDGECGPIVNERRDQILLFTGEHFGAAAGADVVDGQRVLSAYERRGDRFLEELNGWFAGALIDLKRQSILLFNDRFGLQRVYYTHTKDSFAFSSEAKSLLATVPATRDLDKDAAGEFFACGSVLNDKTLFRDIFVLPAGSAWTAGREHKIRKARFFTAADLEQQSPLPENEFYSQLTQTMARVVPRYFRGASAVSLTGGLDTRAILAFAGDGRPDKSYTFGGMYKDCFDVRVAREVADACGCRHEVLRIDDGFLRAFPDLAEKTVWITDGTHDVFGSHELYLSRQARAIAPIRVTGNYGGEILRGASTFKATALNDGLFHRDFLPSVQRARQTLADLRKEHPVSFALFKEVPWLLHGRLRSAESQLTVRSPYTDNEIVALAYRLPVTQRFERWQGLIGAGNARLASIRTDRKRMTNESSVTAHAARLGNTLLFKAEWYYGPGMPHWLGPIDNLLAGRRSPLPFVGTHKIEHYRMWLRDALSDYAQSVLCAPSAMSQAYLNGSSAADVVTAHRRGRRNFSTEINRLMTLELVHRLFIRGHAQPVSAVAPIIGRN